jgi:hypothetical protein
VKPPAKLAAYGAALAVVLIAGAGLGAAVGPLGDGDEPGHEMTEITSTATAAPQEGVEMPAGLAASEAGYTFSADDVSFAPGLGERFTFRILGPDGAAVTEFDTRHEKDLHLVVTSDDLASYQHLHPTLAGDGTWSTELSLPRPAGYRAYADFAPAGGAPLTLTARLAAAGELTPQPLPAPSPAASVDGYEVGFDGELTVGAESELVFRVARVGAAVTDLEPYLGAYGHLVAIRASDGAYLHVHPTEAASPEAVTFAVHASTAGAYRLFFDFQHQGVVRTAAFTLDVPTSASSVDPHDAADAEEGGHGH